MLVSSRFLIASAITAMVASQAVMAAPLLYDDFNGANKALPDTGLWTTFSSYSQGTIAQDGNSHLVAAEKITTGSNYAGTVTNANNFNAFSAPLTIALSGISVGGTTGITTTGNNGAWILYGRSNTDSPTEYHTDASKMAFSVNVGFSATKDVDSGAVSYALGIQEYSDNASQGRIIYPVNGLTGAPTDITLTIDGAHRSLAVALGGATFSSTGLSTLTQSLSSDFTLANMSVGGSLESRIAFGTINSGATTTPSSFSVDSITASVPEPASLGVLGIAGLALMKRRRR